MIIEHINISAPMTLLKKVKEFYCIIFGLREGYRPNFSRRGYWLYSEDKALIHLTESHQHYNGHPNDKQGYFDHIAFQTTGLQGIIEKLKSLEIKFETDHLPEIGMTQLFFKDPAGTGVEVNFLHELLES